MILLAVGCPRFGSFFWGPAFSLPIFSFLVSFCCPCGSATDLLFIFGSLLPWLAYSFGRCCTVINCVLCVSVLSVFSGSLSLYAALLIFLSPFGFVCCRFGASNDFFYSLFTWIEVPLSLVFVYSCLFLFSSVFRPAMSQRPLLVFLVHYLHASLSYPTFSCLASSYGGGLVYFSTFSATFSGQVFL